MNKFVFMQAKTPAEIQRVKKMRFDIFTREQGIPHELDEDGDDDQSIHVLALALDRQTAVASGRLTVNGTAAVLSRIAVHPQYRGQKLGQQVVWELECLAREQKVKVLSLNPHSYLEKFYADLGYRTEVGEKLVGQYTLLHMTKTL